MMQSSAVQILANSLTMGIDPWTKKSPLVHIIDYNFGSFYDLILIKLLFERAVVCMYCII